MAYKLVTPPASEPVSLAEAKQHLRVDHDDDDTLIETLIASARQAAEQRLQRALISQTWELRLDAFPADIELSMAPIQSITSVQFLDTDGALQTLDPADYRLDDFTPPGWLFPVPGTTWPDTYAEPNAVRVRYVCGYGASATDVPQPIRVWMLLAIGTWYAQRESVVSGSVAELPAAAWQSLLDPYRVMRFV